MECECNDRSGSQETILSQQELPSFFVETPASRPLLTPLAAFVPTWFILLLIRLLAVYLAAELRNLLVHLAL